MEPWNIEQKHDFDKDRKKYRSEPAVEKKLADFKLHLDNGEDPRLYGDAKSGKWKNAFTVHVSNELRLCYSIDYDNHTVVLLWLGDHKQY